LDEPNLHVIATKLAHLRRRLSTVTVEPGAQTEAKEKLSVGIEKAVESFKPRAKFLTEIPAMSTPRAEAVDELFSFRNYGTPHKK
jgi:hypothetical protein